MILSRLFIGGHREIRRPTIQVDETLMQRIEQARERLRIEGKEVRPIRQLRERLRAETHAAPHWAEGHRASA